MLVFWAAIFLVGYTYFGYGLAVCVLAWLKPQPVKRQPIRPSVTIVIVAHNEGHTIRTKLESLAALDYPKDRLEVIVASDGSDDDTVAQAMAFGPMVRAVAFPVRRGKPAVLNEVVPRATGSIVVLADARQRFDRGAVAALVEPFADPSIGAVSGELMLLRAGQAETAADGSAFYWSIEKIIRLNEGRLDSMVGATGAIYALRRELFEAIPENIVLDDVFLPLRIVRAGYRVIFEPRAKAFDRQVTADNQEFTRKVRTIAGTFQLFAMEPWLLNPRKNRLWIQCISHKGLRLLLPLFYLVMLASNVMLLDQPFFVWTMAVFVLAGLAALIGGMLPAVKRRVPLVTLPYTVCFLSWATIVAFVRFVAHTQEVTWEAAVPVTTDARDFGSS